MTLDENVIRTKATTQAKSYIPSSILTYTHYGIVVPGTELDNLLRNNIVKSFESCKHLMKTHIVLNRETLVEPDIPSALWTLQLGYLHQTQKLFPQT